MWPGCTFVFPAKFRGGEKGAGAGAAGRVRRAGCGGPAARGACVGRLLRTELLDALRGRGLLARHGIDRLEGIVDPAVVPRLLPAAQLLYLLCACTSRRVVRRLRLYLDIRQASTGRGAGGCMGGGSACANRRRREAGVSQRRALPSVVRGMRARRE